MSEGAIRESVDEELSALWLTIDNPGKRNAMTVDMIRALAGAIKDRTLDDNIKSIVITGEGDDLTSGSDAAETFDFLRDLPGGRGSKVLSQRARLLGADQLFWGPEGLFTSIINSPKAVVLEAKGACLEIGLYLSLACDVVVPAEDCYFGNPRWQYVGADGDISMLNLAVGVGRAKELIFLGKQLSAQEALEWGLIERTLPRSEIREATREVTRLAKSLYRDGIAPGKYYLRSTLAAMHVGTGMAYGTIMGGLASNLTHREGEFNFVKARREMGTTEALKAGQRHFEGV